jgi:hypothetical protein
MGKFRDYLNTSYLVAVDILEVVVVMVEATFQYRVAAMILRVLKIVLPISTVFLGAVFFQQKIPGVENLYPWAWVTIALGGYIAIASFIVACRYRYQLDQHPTVEVAEAPIQDGAYYYFPVTNHGPGNVEVTVTAEDAQFSHGQVNHKSFLPVSPTLQRGSHRLLHIGSKVDPII